MSVSTSPLTVELSPRIPMLRETAPIANMIVSASALRSQHLRIRRISALPHLMHSSAPDAEYRSQQHVDCPRGPQTTSALKVLDKWMFSKAGAGRKSILWLECTSPTFTSSIAQHVSRQCTKRGELAASFFFNPERPKCGSFDHLIPTIALQLARSIPRFQYSLSEAMEDDPFIVYRSLPTQVERLILRPLRKISEKGPFLVAIDALGKCEGEENQREVLVQVLRITRIPRNPLRLVITSSSAHQLQAVLELDEFNHCVIYTTLPSPVYKNPSTPARQHNIETGFISPIRQADTASKQLSSCPGSWIRWDAGSIWASYPYYQHKVLVDVISCTTFDLAFFNSHQNVKAE
ncbi:hypothetical protein H0H92_008394 [Tricholoma furcatifolium]|nr:hypothetical protein H0H92_008394 [Tricholoma furcatifolium]